ncbi:glycosyltransferase [Moritella sp. 24]|uniref:glycosyltransferase n=1 Tax=Moritella sp. 24 TaxID=2746230 RepID=UPI001BA9A1F3|nr:glycosyltransferase [Moritella sp. 24]QUM74918.1 glycosyltransferase [Moritella sp. 24]
MHSVSVVLTSCDRFDLLELTLESFFEFNTYAIKQFIIIEDSPYIDKLKDCLNKFDYDFTVIWNNPRLGQLKSIDKAYSEVTSDYIFHCEDDWKFHKKGFIEACLTPLISNDKILNVWLRHRSELKDSLFGESEVTVSDTSYYLVNDEIFSFNPTIIRMSDYKKVMPYFNFTKTMEPGLSNFFMEQGYFSILVKDGFVEHEGWHRHVLNEEKKHRSNMSHKFHNISKKYKSKVYKFFKLKHFKK